MVHGWFRNGGGEMFGVVLWSSKDDHKAVIWCEDHGDLAFYNGSADSVFDGDALDAGDLIRFNLSEGRDMRLATDPQLIAEQHYPGLVDNLMAKGIPGSAGGASAADARARTAENSNVVQFVPQRGTTRKAS